MALDETTAIDQQEAKPANINITAVQKAEDNAAAPMSINEAAKSHAPEMAKYFTDPSNLSSVFNNEQKLVFDKLTAYTPNDNEAQLRAINQAFVKTQMPDIPESIINNNWDAVKKAYSDTRFGSTKEHINDTEFHTNVSQTYKELEELKNPSKNPQPWDWKAKAAAIGTIAPFAVKNFWDTFTTPIHTFPSAPKNLPNKTYFLPGTTAVINPAVYGAIWNGLKPTLDSLMSPAGILGLKATPPVIEGLEAMSATSNLAKATLVSIKGGFGLIAAKSAIDTTSKFNTLLKDPNAKFEDLVTTGTEAFVSSGLTLLTGLDAALEFFPKEKQLSLVKEIQANPDKTIDILKREEEATDIPGHAEAIKGLRTQIEQVQDIVPKEPVKLEDVTPEKVAEQEAISAPEETIPVVEPQVMAMAAEPEPTLVGPEPTSAIDETAPGDTISIKNEVMDREMESLGLQPAEKGEKKTFEDTVNKINKSFKADPTIGQRLVDELTANPRAPTAEENVLLGIEARKLKNARNAAEESLLKARAEGNTEAEAAAQQQIDILRDQFAKTAATDKLVGTASGQSLAFRKVMLREDYSLASLERKLEIAKGEKLTPQETEELRQTSKQLEEKKRKLTEAEAKQRGELPSEESIDKEYEAKKKKLEDEIELLKAKIKGETPIKKATQKPLTRPEVDEIEMLSQERDSLKETLDLKVTRERQLKSLEDQIAETKKQIKEGVPPPEPKAVDRPAIESIEKARQELEDLKDKLKLKTNTEKQIASLKEQIAEKQRRIEEGDFTTPGKAMARPAIKPIEVLKQKLEDLNKKYSEVKKQFEADAKAEATMRKRVEALDEKINQKLSELQGKPQIVKGKFVTRPQPPEIEQRLQRLSELNKQIAERKKRTPEQISAAREQARIEGYKTRAETLKAKMAAGDVTPEMRKASVMSPEVETARRDYQKVKQQFDRKVYEAEQARRTSVEKAKDLTAKIVRAGILSRVGIIAKLTALVGERAFISPVRQTIKYAAGKVLPDVASAARFEGIESFGGLVRSEAKAFAALWTQGLPGALDILRGKQAPIEETLGLENLPKDVLDYPTQLHKALHFPIQISDYVRRLSLINERDLRAGIDMSEPLNQLRNMQEAWEYSKRSVYLQDNKLVSGYQQMLKTWESTSKTGEFSPLAKTLAFGAKLQNPIVRVPVNVATELTEHVAGLLDPAARFLFNGTGGFKGLKAAEADMLMRHLANGSLGAFLGLYGWFKYKELGGFYVEGDKRKPGDLKPGELKVNGTVIPSTLLKENAFEIMNAGASLHKAFNATYKNTKSITQGAIDGLGAVALGIADGTPYVPDIKQISAIMNPKERNRALASSLANILVPGFVQEAAAATDRPEPLNIFQAPTPRREKEKTFGKAFEKELQLRIPGQRFKVPKAGSQDIKTFAR